MNEQYLKNFRSLIQAETISSYDDTDLTKFRNFHNLLESTFPHIWAAFETVEDFDGSLLLKWKGKDSEKAPILFMNHHDVVEAAGAWTHDPFAAEVVDGKIYGRGTLDTKAGLWGMLQAADDLAKEGFVPNCDIYFESACDEETAGNGADIISRTLLERGIKFGMSVDEGGYILDEPIGGAKGRFAMIGVGEKGCADLKFIAKSSGGHASTPGKDTPLVRLGKFMAAADKSDIFDVEVSPVVAEMLRRLAPTMSGSLKLVLGHPGLFGPIIKKVMPKTSSTAAAMLRTTLAFTMAEGSEGRNVLPQQAYVIGNMRYSHHQGGEASIKAASDLAAKYGIETEILDPGVTSSVADYNGNAFKLVERAVNAVFPGVRTAPYLMTGASDSRSISRVCDDCIRFCPFFITDEQMSGIHGLDENINIDTLESAVAFYKFLMKEA